MMTGLGLRWRFTLVIMLVLGSATLSAFWSAVMFARVSSTTEAKLEHVSGAMALVDKIEQRLEDKDDIFLRALIMPSLQARFAVKADRSTLDELCERLSRAITQPGGRAALSDLLRTIELYRNMVDAMMAERGTEDLPNRYQRDVTPILRQALLDCSHIREHLADFTLQIASAARDEAKRATWVVSGVALMALLLSAFAAFHFGRAVIWPIRDLTESVEAVRRGDFRRRVPLRSQDELGRLAAGFNRMVEALAEHQQSMRVELVAVASHELRTPITTMRVTLSLLSESASQFGDRQREMLETAVLGCEQLAATVDTFLDLTRIETGELKLALDKVNAAKLTADVVNVFAPRCEAAGITLRCSVDPQTPGIRGDTVRLKVVLSNLLSNALKYTPSGGEIAIDVGTASWTAPARPSAPRGVPADPATSRAVCLTVTDTGPGIPAEYRELIFDKFFRVEHYQPRKEEQGARGAGIGLYLSRRVIEAHGGTINCNAPPSGRGTKMTILLPVAEA
jgi:NtrC-family two-component system sensor histidine kinase KinB